MNTCTQCGHPLGVGRFCTNCGHPVAAVDPPGTDTAERPAVPADPRDAGRPTSPPPPRPAEPAPAFETPTAPRFPLYADEPARRAPDLPPAWLTPVETAPRRRSRAPVWVAAAVVLLLVAGLGAFLLVDSSGHDDSAKDRGNAGTPASTSPSGLPSTSVPPSPKPTRTHTPKPPPTRPGKPTDVARFATATAPATAPPGLDVHNNVVRYVPFNMLDGVPASCWRTAGDGSGDLILITLARKTTLTSVGLINGYAKTDPGYDGYTSNRRIKAVQWTFDDGTTVPETLTSSRSMQSIDVSGVTTRMIRLRIVTVSQPGHGKSGRDYTAISDLSLVGTSA